MTSHDHASAPLLLHLRSFTAPNPSQLLLSLLLLLLLPWLLRSPPLLLVVRLRR
jgi:hypothetical protein